MKLTNTQLQNYVDRIKFTQEDKQKYQSQINNLIGHVQQFIKDNTDCKVTRVLQSGSWKKGTILYPKDGIDLDIDLVFFLEADEAQEKDLRQLNAQIKEFLQKAYPNKKAEDFWDSAKTAGVVFKGTGLNFDIVPVVPTDPESYVWQPEKGKRSRYITSIDIQLKFNSSLKEANSHYTSIVRMLKKWKKIKELGLSSFSIEIIEGWLEYTQGNKLRIEDALIRFFDLLSRHQFPNITFDFNYPIDSKINSNSKGAVYIADPANPANNTAEYLSYNDWKLVQQEASLAFETLMYARELDYKNKTIDLWKEVFGSTFSIELLP